MTQRLRIVVTGLITQYPLGGVTWDYIQYVLGLHRMGHDVYYLEDTGFWPYNPQEKGLSEYGCQFNIDYTKKVFESLGLGERWMFRFSRDKSTSEWFGLPQDKRRDVLATADLLINVSGCLHDPTEYRSVKRLAYIDSDPVFTQVKLALGYQSFHEQISAHDVHFTFAENPAHKMPSTAFTWLPTRQPIVLSEWASEVQTRDVLTTIMNWTSYDALEFNGVRYGQKDQEFSKFNSLPLALKQRGFNTALELAVNEGKTTKTPFRQLKNDGWSTVDPSQVCPDPDSYRSFIQRSRAEWSVAKHGYVQGESGWFSCRSACYLAAGRPVVVQDTGFSKVLPCGTGLHAFSTLDEAVNAIDHVLCHKQLEQNAAQEIARAWFDSTVVLQQFVDNAMSDSPASEPVSVAAHHRSEPIDVPVNSTDAALLINPDRDQLSDAAWLRR